MPGFDAHLSRLTSDLRDILRDRIVEATSLSKDGKAFGLEKWAEPKHTKKKPDRWIQAMAQDEGGCQIYVKIKPTAGKNPWTRAKRIPLLHLTEPELLSLKRLVWHPNDPENPLVVLARCAK